MTKVSLWHISRVTTYEANANVARESHEGAVSVRDREQQETRNKKQVRITRCVHKEID